MSPPHPELFAQSRGKRCDLWQWRDTRWIRVKIIGYTTHQTWGLHELCMFIFIHILPIYILTLYYHIISYHIIVYWFLSPSGKLTLTLKITRFQWTIDKHGGVVMLIDWRIILMALSSFLHHPLLPPAIPSKALSSTNIWRSPGSVDSIGNASPEIRCLFLKIEMIYHFFGWVSAFPHLPGEGL